MAAIAAIRSSIIIIMLDLGHSPLLLNCKGAYSVRLFDFSSIAEISAYAL